MLEATVAGIALGLAAPLSVRSALASGGNYTLSGGTPYEQQQVRSALQASSFNWSLVPTQVTIEIGPALTTSASPGQIWLNSGVLDSGEFSWGSVQHEYAHQVDFALFDDAIHARLLSALGATDWCDDASNLRHSQHGCERFASTLAWSYWPSPENAMKPVDADDESAAMAPPTFRALMADLLHFSESTTSAPLANVPVNKLESNGRNSLNRLEISGRSGVHPAGAFSSRVRGKPPIVLSS